MTFNPYSGVTCMKISFEFNNGETPRDIVASMAAFFGLNAHGVVSAAAPALPATSGTLAPADNDDNAGNTPSDGSGLDTTGLPYDARIHSETPSKTDKGVWRKRRNLPAGVFEQVATELRAKIAAGGQSVAQAPAAAPALPPAAAPVAPPPLTPIAAAPALPPAAPVVGPFEKFVAFLAANMPPQPGARFTPEWVEAALRQYNIVDATGKGSVQELMHRDAAFITSVHTNFAQAAGIPV